MKTMIVLAVLASAVISAPAFAGQHGVMRTPPS